jgi:hypothetical protein
MTIAELIAELAQYDPDDRVTYAYVTYKGRKAKKRKRHG